MAMFFLVALLIGSCVSIARGGGIPVEANASQAIRRPAPDADPSRESSTPLILAQADSEWVKQVLRLQYTEFCATVKPPPAALMTAVQEGAKAGNTDAQIAFMWLLRIQERYKENGCGDA